MACPLVVIGERWHDTWNVLDPLGKIGRARDHMYIKEKLK